MSVSDDLKVVRAWIGDELDQGNTPVWRVTVEAFDRIEAQITELAVLAAISEGRRYREQQAWSHPIQRWRWRRLMADFSSTNQAGDNLTLDNFYAAVRALEARGGEKP